MTILTTKTIADAVAKAISEKKKMTSDSPYAICTSTKKKSGGEMGHDKWKRCISHIKAKM